MELTTTIPHINLQDFLSTPYSVAVVDLYNDPPAPHDPILIKEMLIKIPVTCGYTAITNIQTSYGNPFELNVESSNEQLKLYFLYNKHTKTIICNKHFFLDTKKSAETLEGYSVYVLTEIQKKIQDDLKEMVTTLFDKNEKNLMTKFQKEYTETVQNITKKEDSRYGSNVYNSLPKNPNFVPYTFFPFKNNQIDPFARLDFVCAYMNDPSILQQHAIEIFEKNTAAWEQYDNILLRWVEAKTKNKILNKYKENPPMALLLSIEIGKSLEGAGKTVNITTKDGKTVKCETSTFNGTEIRSVQGWEHISIKDIGEITFSRKLLFSA